MSLRRSTSVVARLRILVVAVIATAATLIPSSPANAAPAPQGTYHLNSRYNSLIGDTRGWKIEWRVPNITNFSEAWGAVGTWYYDLEAGVYKHNNGWGVYYFADGDGTAGNNSNCDTQWGSGGICGGPLGGFGAGKKIYFRYQWCDANNVASLTGTRVCLHVDMEDGAGWRFLASDVRGTTEMYAHDIETFVGDYPKPQIPCTTGNATKMIQQQRRRTDGTWANIGGNWWNFENDPYGLYKYQNKNLGVTPSNWESCSA